MKKILSLVMTLIFIFGLFGCNSTTDNLHNHLKKGFPEYYNLTTAKGLEVYVWETTSGTYYCGVLPGTNRNKTDEEISNLAKNGATIEEMKTILSSYDVDKEEITIIPIKNPSSNYEIDGIDFTKIHEIFWGT